MTCPRLRSSTFGEPISAVSRLSWLESKHSFLYGANENPAETRHGLLLVNNEDTVLAGTGCDTHPHQDMEIVT
jgi:quercetin 2,3-dioxygenase